MTGPGTSLAKRLGRSTCSAVLLIASEMFPSYTVTKPHKAVLPYNSILICIIIGGATFMGPLFLLSI